MKHTTDFEFLRDVTWADVFAAWRAAEAERPEWIKVYTAHGHASWDEWRTHNVVPLTPDKRSWSLYRVNEPMVAVPDFLAGPHRAWMKRYDYDPEHLLSFAQLAQHDLIQANDKIQGLLANFPTETMLIGLINNDQVVVIEGMHRCSALARAAHEKLEIKSNVTIALAPYEGSLPRLSGTRQEI